VAVTLQAADLGDTTTMQETLADAGLAVADLVEREAELHPEEKPKVNVEGIEELVADKGYHSGELLSRSRNWKFVSVVFWPSVQSDSVETSSCCGAAQR
jgi:hypothetical protein